VEVKLGEHNALLIRGSNVMLGYWNNPEATRAILSPDGWLNSGDVASIDEQGRVTITGRLKEIIVMSTGEKVPPGDMEAAILRDPLFEQVMLVGEGRSYLAALVVLNSRNWEVIAGQYNLEEPWTVENGMLTPTLKLRRGHVLERYKAEIARLYEGH
jgi:long-chain acyl-CoA synthetase